MVLQSIGKYVNAKEYLTKALEIQIEIGDTKGEATSYGSLGIVYQSVGKYDEAREHHEKALAIRKEIGHRKGEGADHGNLGVVFFFSW